MSPANKFHLEQTEKIQRKQYAFFPLTVMIKICLSLSASQRSRCNSACAETFIALSCILQLQGDNHCEVQSVSLWKSRGSIL